ncbi:glucose/mannose transport system permease protein [Bradyrhizobium ottawaense]
MSNAAAIRPGRPALPEWVRRLPEYLMIWVPLLLSAAHLVSFSLWTIWISFTPSTLVPVTGWVGLRNYSAVAASRNWQIAFDNLLLFGSAFVLLSLVTGLALAILLDQRIRGENLLRSVFLYPLAVSFVVTGTVWSWLLNPGLGIQKLVHDLGWTSFKFDWLIDRDMAIWTIVIAAIWQSSGFAMALFLAGLRSVDTDIIKAAQIDGAGPFRIYRRIILPSLWPITHHRRRDPVAVRDFDIRPRPRAHQRRAGNRNPAASTGRLRPDVPAQPARPGSGGGGAYAAHSSRGAAAVCGVAICSATAGRPCVSGLSHQAGS